MDNLNIPSSADEPTVARGRRFLKISWRTKQSTPHVHGLSIPIGCRLELKHRSPLVIGEIDESDMNPLAQCVVRDAYAVADFGLLRFQVVPIVKGRHKEVEVMAEGQGGGK